MTDAFQLISKGKALPGRGGGFERTENKTKQNCSVCTTVLKNESGHFIHMYIYFLK